ncbi:Transcriptional regulator, TetR family [Neorhizobium galegae bv. officinalis bv. officinalis str. HAMBI 1141]|uniref:Transcriptional regulator, TetR family n=1 Tax=Neorhizobium galegae bv. officinalis bv. officinalis str. HAMBI 1141 TaxID=1028801 RepID=A0A068TFB6_NEOGA|nr:TetR/AcrR family transcriptional regulator [Neorhizobium galegae]CDN56761.1 Transcriptional regulator, TetR family [Neorhizobium galegae bv. officinalis bv. officinalis str. HAMBI 1141]
MARPREFDEEKVLLLAVERFWEHGYEATSIRDLAQAIGLTTASIYNAFGDKRAFYRKALDFYVERSFGDRVGRFETKPPREAIGAFFNEIIDRSLSDTKRKGCMLVNSALEVAPHDDEFQRVVAQVLVQVEAFFRRCIESGQKDGSINRCQNASDMAGTLLGTLLGIRVLARTRPDRDLLEGLIRPIFALLEPQSQSDNLISRSMT